MNKFEKLIFISLILISFYLRFYNIKNLPFFPFSDEVHQANAVISYLTTGRDIDGKIHIFFYDQLQYTPPIIGISMIPFLLTLGVNAFSVRLPSIIYSLLSIFIIYKLTLLLIKNNRIGLLVSFLYAFIPWPFPYSRIGWEQSSFFFFFLISIYFLLKGRFKGIYFVLGCLFSGLSIYSYSTATLLSLLFLLAICVLFYQDFLRNKRSFLRGIFLFFLIVIPVTISYLTEPLMSQRPQRIFVATGKTPSQTIEVFTTHYLEHLSWSFLFQNGDPNRRHNIKGYGELYPIMFPFIILGLIYFLRRKDRFSLFIIFWLAVFPLSSALADDGNPHATRSLIGASLFCILAGAGFLLFSSWLSRLLKDKVFLKLGIYLILGVVTTASIFSYFKDYFLVYPQDLYYSGAWDYGQQEVFEFVKNNLLNYQRVCLNHYNWRKTDIFIHFYLDAEGYKTKIFNNENIENCFAKNSLLVLPANQKLIAKPPIFTVFGLDKAPVYEIYSF